MPSALDAGTVAPAPVRVSSPVLVVGVPRSGTTWVARLLGETKDAAYLEEPDNHLTHPFAFRAKRNLPGRFYPALRTDEPAIEYERLWRHALHCADNERRPLAPRARRLFAGTVWRSVSNEEIRQAFLRPTSSTSSKLRVAEALAVPARAEVAPAHLVVKSVYAALSIEWIAARFPVRVVVVLRDLRNVLSSWVELDWVGTPGDDMLDSLDPAIQERLSAQFGVATPAPNASPLQRGAWLLGILTLALRGAAQRHHDWAVVRHEDLCRDPDESFRALSAAVGLDWTPESSRVLTALDRPGSGTERTRVSRELPEVWRSRLRPEQLEEVEQLLDHFEQKLTHLTP